jgi:hypothetical protein
MVVGCLSLRRFHFLRNKKVFVDFLIFDTPKTKNEIILKTNNHHEHPFHFPPQ